MEQMARRNPGPVGLETGGGEQGNLPNPSGGGGGINLPGPDIVQRRHIQIIKPPGPVAATRSKASECRCQQPGSPRCRGGSDPLFLGIKPVIESAAGCREKWKDDKVRLQQETMELYKSEKINPLAGCLPIFLQIPIFYALYKTLMLTLEMRHQPFALWIKDLSAPDPLTPINLFGLLPFTPPSIIALGVLPIILGISMWLQQKFNPQPMDPAQQQIFAWMPWIFMVIMAPFAAGLVVYWIVSNFFTVGQQWLLLRRHPVPSAEPTK